MPERVLSTKLARSSPRTLSDTQFAIALVLPAMTLFTFVIVYPLVNSMYIGFFEKSLVFPGERFVGLENIQRVLSNEFLALLQTTLVFTIGATILPFIIGLILALVLNSSIRGQGILRGLFLLPWLIPGVVVSFLWLWIFNANYGVLNGALRITGVITENINWLGTPVTAMIAVIIAKTWQSFPWMAVMLLAGLQTIPRELNEAAAMDGAGRRQVFWNVTIPQLRGIISSVLLLEVIWNFQHLEMIYVMTTGGPAKATTTFAISVYDTAFHALDLGRAGAIGIIWMVLLAGLVAVYLRLGAHDDE
jgi:multiple sugar transport system permease protein